MLYRSFNCDVDVEHIILCAVCGDCIYQMIFNLKAGQPLPNPPKGVRWIAGIGNVCDKHALKVVDAAPQA